MYFGDELLLLVLAWESYRFANAHSKCGIDCLQFLLVLKFVLFVFGFTYNHSFNTSAYVDRCADDFKTVCCHPKQVWRAASLAVPLTRKYPETQFECLEPPVFLCGCALDETCSLLSSHQPGRLQQSRLCPKGSQLGPTRLGEQCSNHCSIGSRPQFTMYVFKCI